MSGRVIGVGGRAVKRVKGPVLCSYIHFPTLDRELSALKLEFLALRKKSVLVG